jgi:hypothetical protein
VWKRKSQLTLFGAMGVSKVPERSLGAQMVQNTPARFQCIIELIQRCEPKMQLFELKYTFESMTRSLVLQTTRLQAWNDKDSRQ